MTSENYLRWSEIFKLLAEDGYILERELAKGEWVEWELTTPLSLNPDEFRVVR